MKAEIKSPREEVTFPEFSLVLTVETAEDARALYALFNHSANVRLVSAGLAINVRNLLTRRLEARGLGTLGRGNIIANDVSYDDYYRTR